MHWLCIRFPALVSEALAANEREALERLAAWAYQWTSWVSYRPSTEAPPELMTPVAPLLWLELSASRILFGEPEALLQKIQSDLTRLGHSHVCALAPSPTAAALLTLLPEQRVVHTRAQLRARLERLPLALLELSVAIITALRSAGLRTIGEVLALPAAGLARRFGPQIGLYLGRLNAHISDPRPAWHLPPRYRARCEFSQELHETGMLLFSLQRLLLEFQGYLRARDCAVQRFALELEHTDHPASRLTIGMSAPTRAAAQFLLLARERLHNLVLPAPVRALSVSAEEFTAAAIGQLDGFSSAPRQLDEISQLLDRVRARLGEESVQSLRPQADHRPERAWRAWPVEPARLTSASASCARRSDQTAPRRPCALLSSPRPLITPPQLLSGPERIESGWWDGAEALRDYYLAEVQGARAWVFQDLSQGGWYLHGLWV
jgi:protein ImuB